MFGQPEVRGLFVDAVDGYSNPENAFWTPILCLNFFEPRRCYLFSCLSFFSFAIVESYVLARKS